MEQSQTWAEALKINPKKLNEWSALAPDGVPVLLYVLQEGHITVARYLEWASARFNLPVLNENYFDSTFDSDGARNMQFALGHEWKPWMFPVEQWDGVVIVACMEPPSESIGEEYRFVLADPLVLQRTWSHMASSFTSTTLDSPNPVEGDVEIPNGITSTSIKPFKLTLDDLNESNLFRSGLEPAPAAPPTPDSHEVELPEASVVTATSTAAKAPPIPLPMAVEDAAVEEFEPPPVAHMPMVPESSLPTIPAPPELVPSDSVPSISRKPKTKPVKAKTKGPILTETQQLEQIELAFAELKALYKNVFLMKCQEGIARLFKWDDSMKPTGGGKNIAVELAFPTFLRIISKTQLPYHGYLVDSPAHRDFFNSLKITDLPGCVTGIPIKDGSHLVGVLVGVGDDNLQKLDILRKAEESAETLIDALAPAWGKAA